MPDIDSLHRQADPLKWVRGHGPNPPRLPAKPCAGCGELTHPLRLFAIDQTRDRYCPTCVKARE